MFPHLTGTLQALSSGLTQRFKVPFEGGWAFCQFLDSSLLATGCLPQLPASRLYASMSKVRKKGKVSREENFSLKCTYASKLPFRRHWTEFIYMPKLCIGGGERGGLAVSISKVREFCWQRRRTIEQEVKVQGHHSTFSHFHVFIALIPFLCISYNNCYYVITPLKQIPWG